MVAAFNLSWRAVHDNMLMRRSIALENLTRTISPIDEDQKWIFSMRLLKAPPCLEGIS